MPQAPSRRDPCPCGSGKRYKDCHGALTSAPGVTSDGGADALLRAAQVAFNSGDRVAARTLLERALAREPDRTELLRERARIEWVQGDASAAAASCRAALARAPTDVVAWNLLGEILRTSDGAAAEAAWREALALDATNPEASFHLGNTLRKRGEIAPAIEHYRQALRRAPGHAGARNNLGLALEASAERDAAEQCYREVLAQDAQHADAWGNLARLLFERERFAAAAAAYARLVAVRRELPPAVWVERAIAQQASGDLPAAETSFREAARLAPDHCAIQLNLGTVCAEQRRHAEAEPAWLRALELEPHNLYALSMLAHGRQHRCDWRGLEAIFAEINRLLEAADANGRAGSHPSPFALLSMPTSLRARLLAARLWASGFTAAQPVSAPAVSRVPGEPLRVGFVSSDFGEHPMASLWMECWERFDPARIETFGYAIRPPDPGAIGRRITRSFAHFADVSAEGTAPIASRIRADDIAILIDLNGYTRNSRERIFALRPAPVQVNSIGFPGSLGAPWYDYIHVDRFVLPESLQEYYSERPLYMPESFYPSDTTRAPRGPAPTRRECGLPEAGFVYACFNNAYKILPDMFALWMRLLQAVPGSVLWLLQANAAVQANLRGEAARLGVDPERLVFAPHVPVAAHVARNAAADLLLDTYPYGAHTTANDALLAGLPVLTLVGEALTSRIAGSQLNAVGLPELVTTSSAAYETLAVDLARDPAALSALRMRLAANRHTQPLFDMARYARDFVDALERVWLDHAGTVPD
jgi:predicted O-linked N-acetylglucosamine transferase (SPINDLY family)